MDHSRTTTNTGNIQDTPINQGRGTPVIKGEKPRSTDMDEGSLKHVLDTGLPPGIEPADLTNPNRNRPPGQPNDDNS